MLLLSYNNKKVVDNMKLSEISSKDVIDDEDGTRLGKIADAEIDVATGKILNVNIYRSFKFLNWFNNKDVIQIPWNNIIKIGNDVIIVENRQKRKEDI
jgi:YlmC/YmxH family sporulation protein